MNALRRIRAALGTALLWAIVWGAAGVVALPYLAELAGGRLTVVDGLGIAATIAWYGFLAGLVFSCVLAVAARRRRFGELTPRGMGIMGAAASVVLTAPPMVYMLAGRTDGWRGEDLVYLGGSLVLSAACAAGSLVLARRGAGIPSEMLFSAAASPAVPVSTFGSVSDARRPRRTTAELKVDVRGDRRDRRP